MPQSEAEHKADICFFAQAYAYRIGKQISWLILNGQGEEAVKLSDTFERYFDLANFGEFDRVVIRGACTNAQNHHRSKYIKDNPGCGVIQERTLYDWL